MVAPTYLPLGRPELRPVIRTPEQAQAAQIGAVVVVAGILAGIAAALYLLGSRHR